MEKLRSKEYWPKVTKLLNVGASGFQFMSVWLQRLCSEGLLLRQKVIQYTLSDLSPCGTSVITILRQC